MSRLIYFRISWYLTSLKDVLYVREEKMFRGQFFTEWVLTAHHHHRHRENLLAVCRRGNVAKSDGGETGHGEVERGDVQSVLAGTPFPLARSAGVVAIRRPDAQGQLVQPAVRLDAVGGLVNDLVVPDAVPDAGEPVGHQAEDTNQQDQNRCPVLQVVVQFPGHSTQTQQADHF